MKWCGMFKRVMLKQKSKNNQKLLQNIVHYGLTGWKSLSILAVVTVLVASIVIPRLVRADSYDDQVRNLQNQNAANKDQVVQLAAQAQTYQQAIDQLQAQVNQLQDQINANQAKSADLQRQITDAEQELAKQRKILGESIRAMYLEGQITTLEMLASSKDLSDFVDKQQYRSSVQNKIKSTVDKINALKVQLKNQKQQVEDLLKEQQALQSQVAADRDKQAQMLAYTQDQKRSFEAQIRQTNQQISSIRAQQAAFYSQITGGGTRNYGSAGAFQFRALSSQQYCGGGYSYCWAAHDQYVSDTWGLGLARECVHYAADRAARGLNLAPYLGAYYGAGNATNWPNQLGGAYRVDRSPEVGSVAIAKAQDLGNPYGHAMYVEYVLGDGWVGVSQMNWDGRGSFSTMEIKTSGVWFVHFK
jgi:peptidoglycan hydrolase CwlO-like protein/surface antigen